MDIPSIVPKPPLALWLFERNMTIRDGARYFDTNHETLRRTLLPFTDPALRVPYAALMRRIIALTDGAIRPDDWYPSMEAAA